MARVHSVISRRKAWKHLLYWALLFTTIGGFAGELFAQSHQFTLNQRRRADQIWVEVWCKSTSATPTRLGEATLRVQYNTTYLSLADYLLAANNPDATDSIRYDLANLSASAQAAAVVSLQSPFDPNGAAATSYQNLTVGTSVPGIAELQVRKALIPDTGFVPSSTGRGSYVGKIVFTLNAAFGAASAAIRDSSTTHIAWGSGANASVVYNYGDTLISNASLTYTNPSNFLVKGLTIINPNGPSEVVDRDGVYFTDLIAGYPIYFERSGLSTVATVATAALAEYGDEELAYYVDYRLSSGAAFQNIGSIDETGTVANTGTPLDVLTDESAGNAWDGLLTQYGNAINAANNGSGTIYPNYRHPIRAIWTSNANYAVRSEQAQLRIRMRSVAGPLSGNAATGTYLAPGGDTSNVGFVLGRVFFAQLNGSNQHFKSTQNYLNATELTVEAWVNLNTDKGTGANPGIIASGLGPNTQEGAFILYLKDGKYPAFKVREILGRDGGYLAELVSPYPINVASAAVPISSAHSEGWRHIAATVNNNIVTLYVDGEIIDRKENNFATNMRMLLTSHPVWLGVNPNGTSLTNNDYLHAGLKGVRIWRTELTQVELRERVAGIPNANGTAPVFTATDLRKGLEMQFDFEGRTTDQADDLFFQLGSQTLTYTNNGLTTTNPTFRPDQPHIRITAPQAGVGVVNLTGADFVVRWVGYGLGTVTGNGAPDGTRDVAIEFSHNNTSNWTLAKNAAGSAVANNLGYNATPATGAIVDFESGTATWRPFNNETTGPDGGGALNLRDLGAGIFSQTGYLRIRGVSAFGQETLSSTAGPFVIAPYLSLRKGAADSIVVPAGTEFNINSTKATLEAWVRPHYFPAPGQKFPILSKVGDGNVLHYSLSLLSSGQLEFSVRDLNGQTRTAVSDTTKPLLEPRTLEDDTTWTHVAVFFDRSANQTQVGFWIDGNLQSETAIVNQLGVSLKLDSLNTYKTYIGYQPGVGGFVGELREVRFWNGEPGGAGTADARRQQIQGAQSLNLAAGTNLVAAFNFNGGSFVNGTGLNAMYNYTFANSPSTIRTTWNSGGMSFVATRPFIKIAEPIFNERIANSVADYRLRWVGFNYLNASFTTGVNAGAPPSLMFSLGGGGGNIAQPFQYVTSLYHDNSAPYGSTVANQGFRIVDAGPSLATGADYLFSGQRYAARWNVSNSDPDATDNGVFGEAGEPLALSAVLTSGRLQLSAAVLYNNGSLDTVRSVSRVFTITPASNFSIRAILEGYHEGDVAANATPTPSASTNFRALGTTYNTGGLKIKLYSNIGNLPGVLVDSTESLSGYHANAFTLSSIVTDVRTDANDGPVLALVPFVFTAVPDGSYFVVVQHRNHLPVMSRIPATYVYSGDNYTTYQNESGWDFTHWAGGIGPVTGVADTPNDPVLNAHANLYSAFGSFDDSPQGVNYGITGLVFNEGRDGLSGVGANYISSMVAGDLNQDTWIDATDRVIVRNEIGATVNLRSDVDASNVIDATDRTIVDRNVGRRSSLYQVLPSLASEADGNAIASLKAMTDKDIQLANDMNSRLGDALVRGSMIQNIDGGYSSLKKGEKGLSGAVKYTVSAEPKIVGNKVEVPMYIINQGSEFALANCTFAVNFNPEVLKFNSLKGAENVVFKNGPTANGYQGIVTGPVQGVKNAKDNFRSIELLFDAAIPTNTGVNVPATKTYLGTLTFDMNINDRAIKLGWFNTSVWTTEGRNITKYGTFGDIPSILTYTASMTYPNGGERFATGRNVNVRWNAQSTALVHVELSKDGGISWERITFNPISASDKSLGWLTPSVPSFNNLIRVIDSETGMELDRSDAPFTIAPIFAAISRPATTDPVYKYGATDNIIWASDGLDKVRFEFSDFNNPEFGWKQVVAQRSAADGSVQWQIPANVNTTKAVVRMIDLYDNQESARSTEFKVLAGTLTFTYPKEGNALKAGSNDRIRWNLKYNVNLVDIQFSADGGASWTTVRENVDATKGLMDWQVPNMNTSNGMLRAIYPGTAELEYDRTTFFTVSGATGVQETQLNGVSLFAPEPNPFGANAVVRFVLPSSQYATITLNNALGQRVSVLADNQFFGSGANAVTVKSTDLAAGSYTVRLETGGTVLSIQAIVVK